MIWTQPSGPLCLWQWLKRTFWFFLFFPPCRRPPPHLSPLCTRYSILLNTRSCLKQLKFFQNFLQSNVVICFINCVCKNMVNDYCALKGYTWHHNLLRSIICGINLVPDDSNLRNGIISPLSRLSRWNIKSSWAKRTNEIIKWKKLEKNWKKTRLLFTTVTQASY